jgi:hypothetical protein
MNLFENLASHGLTISILQILIIGGIALVIIGLFWQYIVAGAVIAFCVAVFAMSPASSKETIVDADDAKQKSMFMEDCLKYETKKSCNDIWLDRLSES